MELRRPSRAVTTAPVLDPEQARAVAHRGRSLLVLGAPGTGRTTVAVERAVAAVDEGLAPGQVLVLSHDRQAAGRLRDALSARVTRTHEEPMARTHASFAFSVLRREAALRGDVPPRLISGPEQDLILRDMLEGHAAGLVRGPQWPADLLAATGTRGFRNELRDLLMRAVELGLTPADLRLLGQRHDRPEWCAAADALAEYDDITALARPGAYDPAWITGAAADVLAGDADALARLHADVALVIVDDAQELTASAARLLAAIVSGPVAPDVVLVGDADSALQGFRGGDHRRFVELADQWQAERVILATDHRQRPALRAVTQRVAARVGAGHGVWHRQVRPGRDGATGVGDERGTDVVRGGVEVAVLRSSAQEAAHIAWTLRHAHLVGGLPWSRMAVITRGHGGQAALERALVAQGVPVDLPGSGVVLRDEPAVRPLLEAYRVALALARGETVAPEDVVTLVRSPIGGADAVGLRRVRRALRRVQRALLAEADDEAAPPLPAWSGDELLVRAVHEPVWLLGGDPALEPLRRVAATVRAGAGAALWDVEEGRWAADVDAEGVLWALWSASGLARLWRGRALARPQRRTDEVVPGERERLRQLETGRRADHDLDVVMALFGQAAAFVDRLPGAGPESFLHHVLGQAVGADSLVAQAPRGDAVELLTPQGAAGREWSLVVVAGVQQGAWPDLRLRGSVLGSEHLVDVVTGRDQGVRAAQAAVRHDEARQFHVAVSRAQDRLVVTAVQSEDEQPSPYLDLVDPLDVDRAQEGRGLTVTRPPLTLAGTVAALRRDLVAASGEAGVADGLGAVGHVVVDHPSRAAAAEELARLVRAGVPGAAPSEWWGLAAVSEPRARRADDDAVRVSPSKVEVFGSCGLRWFLEAHGGTAQDRLPSSVGTLVHDIAAEHHGEGLEVLEAELDRRWPELGLGEGWLARREREQARRMLRRLPGYERRAQREGWSLVGVEVPVRVQVGRAVISGRVDRLERHEDGRVRVVDLKTGKGAPSAGSVLTMPQLGVYQVAVEAGGFSDALLELAEREGVDVDGLRQPVAGGGALVYVSRDEGRGPFRGVSPKVLEQPGLAAGEDPRWAHDLLAETAEGMAGERFTATPGALCRSCQLARSCPAQPEGHHLA